MSEIHPFKVKYRPSCRKFKLKQAHRRRVTFQVFDHGKMVRDFTFVDDVVEAIVRVAAKPATADANWSGAHPDPATSYAPYRIYNLGNSEPVELMRYIQAIELASGKKAVIQMLPMQAGDVRATAADVSRLNEAVGFRPNTTVEVGVARFVEWYRGYYQA